MSSAGRLTRRSALKLGLAGAAGAVGLNEAAAQQPAPQRPAGQQNILFLLVDQQRYPTVYESDALRAFRTAELPAQTKLAQSGITFDRHYAASVACVPSRVSLYTGHYPSLHGAASTPGAAKSANDPDMCWLEPGSVPTVGHYLREAGYRTFWKGRWQASRADRLVPGTQRPIASYDSNGMTDEAKTDAFLKADVLEPFGFSGWVGPEPFGPDALRTGSSAGQGKVGRDQAICTQVLQTLSELDASDDARPWFLSASFCNPHDIALWGYVSSLTPEQRAAYDFTIPTTVPAEPFDRALFGRTHLEKLDDKPSCQRAYRDGYARFLPPSAVTADYFRLYYRLHADVDRLMAQVLDKLAQTRFAKSTIIVFTSDHGDILGAHGGQHQKWYSAYDEAVRVPLVISAPWTTTPESVRIPTSHVDLVPTLLGLGGVNPNQAREALAPRFTDALPLVGRDLSPLVRGEPLSDKLVDPIYFMSDDDPSRGLNQNNFLGVPYDSVPQPNHVEAVIALIEGEIWKYTRYFDHPRFWSSPGTPGAEGVRDVVNKPLEREGENDGVQRFSYEERVRLQPAESQYEMYNLTADPMELENLAGKPQWKERESSLRDLLVEQCARKRLVPKSGVVPGEDGCRKG